MMQGWHGPLLVVGWFVLLVLILMAVEALFIAPGIGVSPTATLVMLGFWTWLWGPIALILATPLTACLMVLARFLPQFKFVEVVLGDRPVLDAPARLYQRLLSRDVDEARRLFDDEVRDQDCVAACDGLLRPALLHAAADRVGRRISAHEYATVIDGAAALVAGGADPAIGAETQLGAAKNGDGGPDLRVLCIARDDFDRVGYLMLRGALGPRGFELDIGSGKLLLSEAIDTVARGSFDAVCIGIAPAGGLFAAKLVCRQLRRRFPAMPILAAHWAELSRDARERSLLLDAGATAVYGSIDELRLGLIALGSSIRPAVRADASEPAVAAAS
jgi:hypothetical protein